MQRLKRLAWILLALVGVAIQVGAAVSERQGYLDDLYAAAHPT